MHDPKTECVLKMFESKAEFNMPKILWMSPYCLHDVSSGASVNATAMLECLVKKGFEVWSCASFVFDNPAGTVVFGDLEKKLAEDDHKTFILDDNGIHYIYTRCNNRSEMQFTLAEGQLLYDTFIEVLDEFKPDIVFGYCPGMTSLACYAEARRRGIKTVYHLVNGNHGGFSFAHYDLILTDSQATSNLYAQRDHINVVATGAFFTPERFISPEREPKYVTYINPVGAKGLPIFAKIAKVCQTEMPDLKFLVINSRGNFAQTVTMLHEKDKPEVHPFKASDFPNVDMASSQKDMRPVYKVSKALIAPSLWYESWSRVTTEAVLNRIPVLCSTSGGLAEAMAGCGEVLEAPLHCQNDFMSVPTDEEIRPWIDALKRVLSTDYSEKFDQAKEQFSLERVTARTIEAFRPLYQGRATDNPLYYMK